MKLSLKFKSYKKFLDLLLSKRKKVWKIKAVVNRIPFKIETISIKSCRKFYVKFFTVNRSLTEKLELVSRRRYLR